MMSRSTVKAMTFRAGALGMMIVFASQAFAVEAAAGEDKKAVVKEEKLVLKTYPFSDPDPVPLIGPIYPYFKFRGYSLNGKDQEWRMVRLENPYVRIMVAPDIGGKIWGGLEKSAARYFIYFNNVVKFREIALRGPWTSGGTEFNFGIIGHTPSTATPVDYATRENSDGSVSCFVGAMDIPSRTQWRVEIRVPRDKAYVQTECFWYNPTPLRDSYYHWMTTAADASSDLRFYYPGTNFIGHGGNASTWPQASGRDVSFYRNNNFDGSKSYHILGEFGEYFGGYWEDAGFGYGHWAAYSDKPGMKLWIWSLARDGEIWRDLLTDKDNKQYIEPQTGLLYNQAAADSSFTPFKHVYFDPYSVARWKEIWFPVKDIGGISAASPFGALNVTVEKESIRFGICPIQAVDDELTVMVAGEKLFSRRLALQPMETFINSVALNNRVGEIVVDLGGGKIRWSSADQARNKLSRPVELPKDYNWNSAEGLFTAGEELARQRDYDGALKKFEACLIKEPFHTRALTRTAEILGRKNEHDRAREYALRVLGVDAYDPAANFVYGVASRALGKTADAKDGFGWASRSLDYRSAAYTQLAEIFMVEKDAGRAEDYARRALDFNKYNVPALELLAAACRRQNDRSRAEEALAELLEVDPLDHFARFEGYLLDRSPELLKVFTSTIRNELPHESYLEMSSRYLKLGLEEEARWVLEAAPSYPTIDYRLAYLYRDLDPQKSEQHLNKAAAASARLVFPFRQEDIQVFEWALSKKNDWRSRYYLGLILWNLGKRDEAEKLLEECADSPDFAPFYLARARFFEENGTISRVLKDISRAVTMDTSDWKAWHTLTVAYDKNGLYAEALQSAKTISARYPDNFVLAMDYAKSLLNTGKYEECLSVLVRTQVLPYEGASEGHEIYRRAGILAAAESLRLGNLKRAETLALKAKEWPENLGAGRPNDVDERLEDFVAALAYEKLGDKKKADEAYQAVAAAADKFRTKWDSLHLASAIALKKIGKGSDAIRLIADWRKNRPAADPVPDWGSAVFQDDPDRVQEILIQMAVGPRAEKYRNGDRNFPLMLKVMEAVK